MEKGKAILFSLYWHAGQWNDGNVTEEDYAYAKERGFLFDPPEAESHEDALKRAKAAVEKIDARDVANAFLYSLSTRELQYRSALGSYYYAKAIPEHRLEDTGEDFHCYLCGWCNGASDYNVFSFERYKWGGVRHTQLDYAAFDLEQFLKQPKVTPREEDISALRELLACVRELEPRNKAGKLRDLVSQKKLLQTNKNEITGILEILGICGILAGTECPGYETYFADEYCRAPQEHTNDMQYPLNHWRVSDGINEKRFEEVFGFSLFPD